MKEKEEPEGSWCGLGELKAHARCPTHTNTHTHIGTHARARRQAGRQGARSTTLSARDSAVERVRFNPRLAPSHAGNMSDL